MGWKAGDFDELCELGRGGMAVVCLARHLASGTLFALKRSRWPLQRLDSSERGRAVGEAKLLRELCGDGRKDPFSQACKYFGCFEEDCGRLVLVLEFIPGAPLLRHLRTASCGFFSLERGRHYLAEVVEMFDEMHRRGVVYRDLKLTNIILEPSRGRLRLVDFGFAKQLSPSDGPAGSFRRTYSTVGTAYAMAPEMLRYFEEPNEDGFCEVGYTFSTDWWNLGVLACELFSGRPPFGYRDGDISDGTTMQALAAGSPATIEWCRLPGPLCKGDSSLGLTARSLVMALLQADPAVRLGSTTGAEEVREHPFFQGFDLSEAPPGFDETLGFAPDGSVNATD